MALRKHRKNARSQLSPQHDSIHLSFSVRDVLPAVGTPEPTYANCERPPCYWPERALNEAILSCMYKTIDKKDNILYTVSARQYTMLRRVLTMSYQSKRTKTSMVGGALILAPTVSMHSVGIRQVPLRKAI